MTKRTGCALGLGVLAAVILAAVLLSPRGEFIVGGAMVNVGFRLQDRLSQFDFEHDESITPDEIWQELERQNELAAGVRGLFPRTERHPVVAILRFGTPSRPANFRSSTLASTLPPTV